MEKPINLSNEIKRQIPSELVDFMRLAGEKAQRRGQGLYLVGGVVRDLLLKRTNLDIDVVVEGDAIALAEELAQARRGQITTHTRFGTAKIRWDGWSADLATARAETYAKPGALPTVKPGRIDADLFRRDFTINALAVRLDPGRYGELVDLYGGLDDLERKLVRILHENSFSDDATRIWRAVRYEQRLDFTIEPKTLALLKRDIPMLATISGDRIRHELERALEEEYAEKTLRRANELGVLAKLHPALKGDGWLAQRFALAREAGACDPPEKALYLALMAYRLSPHEAEELASYLRLPKTKSQVVQDTVALKVKLAALAEPNLPPSGIYSLLAGYVPLAVTANMMACDSTLVRERIQAFLDRLRYVRPLLTGNDLKKLGIAPGPRLKEVLDLLRAARLDGKVSSREGEVEMVREMEKKRRV